METRTAELADELSKLYNEAKTKEEYGEVMKRGEEIKDMLQGEYPDITASVLFSSYWAGYYDLLKFPTSSADENRHEFLSKIRNVRLYLKDPDNKVALLYLESVVLSNLLGDQKSADWCIFGVSKIISEEEVSIASILRFINSRVVKEMADKNWNEAVEISKEIERFPKRILEQPENLRLAGHIFSNRGASYIRGDIDIDEGREKLLIAKGLYLQEKVPPENHLTGIKNRLREADEKS